MNTVAAHPETFNDLAIELAEQRVRAEHELIGSVLSDPIRGLKRAAAAGLRGHHFQNDDLLTVYLACVALQHLRKLTGDVEQDQLNCCLLAREGLRRDGWWRGGDFGYWNNESLAALADQFPGPSQTEPLALKVIEL